MAESSRGSGYRVVVEELDNAVKVGVTPLLENVVAHCQKFDVGRLSQRPDFVTLMTPDWCDDLCDASGLAFSSARSFESAVEGSLRSLNLELHEFRAELGRVAERYRNTEADNAESIAGLVRELETGES